MMETEAQVRLVVAAGATLLDESTPEWFDTVDLNRLDMESPYDSVLGQLYENFVTGLKFLGLHTRDIMERQWYGFAIIDYKGYWYDDLTREWVSVIEKRRAKAQNQRPAN